MNAVFVKLGLRYNEGRGDSVDGTYICSVCGGEFEADWSEEEAEQELKENFPGLSKNDCDLVCDDCYKKLGFGT